MRKVNDVRPDNEVGLEVVSRPRDTYVRPAAPKKDQLVSIAETLTRINPQLNKYLAKKEEEKKTFEEAVGADLWRRYGDKSSDEIREMVRNGEVEGFKRLTRNHINGIHRMRHQTIGMGVEDYILSMEGLATIDDGKGNQIPLSEATDRQAVQDWFWRTANAYVSEKTGGVYDPVLYEKEIGPQLEIAKNTFVQRQVNSRANKLMNDAVQTFGGHLNIGFEHFMKKGALIEGGEEAMKDLTNYIMNTADYATRHMGLSDDDVWKQVSLSLQAVMKDMDEDNTYRVIEIAKQIGPLWDRPATRLELERASEMSYGESLQRSWHEKSAREAQAEMAAYDAYQMFWDKYDGDMKRMTPEELKEAKRLVGAAGFGTLARLFSSDMSVSQNWGEMFTTMDEAQYQGIRLKAARGQLSDGQVLSYAGQMSFEQQRQLMQTHNSAQGIKDGQRNKESGTAKGTKFIIDLLEDNWADLKLNSTGSGQANANKLQVTTALIDEIADEVAVVRQENPNASVEKLQQHYRKIAENIIRKHGDKYNLYVSDPNTVGASPKQQKAAQFKVKAEKALEGFGSDNPLAEAEKDKIVEAAKNGKQYIPDKKAAEAIAKSETAAGRKTNWKTVQKKYEAASVETVEYFKALKGE